MRDERLLRRIQTGRDSSVNGLDIGVLAESIKCHLVDLLNSRRGSTQTVPDYGLPDFNDIAKRFPDSIGELASEISNTIRKYEPRLKNVQVTHIAQKNSPLDLRYQIVAEINIENLAKSIWFETTLKPSGEVYIKG